MTRPGLEPVPPASEANALTITLSGPVMMGAPCNTLFMRCLEYLADSELGNITHAIKVKFQKDKKSETNITLLITPKGIP